MWQQIRNNPRAAVLAILAHVIFVAVLLVSFTFSADEDTGSKGPTLEVIKAEAIDETQINAERKRRDAEKHQQQKIKDQARKKKEAQLREKKRKAEKKKKQAAEKKRKLAEKKRKKKAAEKKRKAELKKKQEREKRLAKEKKRKQIERRRIEEEERKNQEELARQDAAMQKKLAADRQRQAAARQASNQHEINKFMSLIKNVVNRHWTRSSTNVSGLSCVVKVKIIPNGEVIDVQIIKSSGNLAFDRSVEKAVYRAAPLPVPSVESGLFDKFREVNFVFNPRDV